AYTHRTGKRGIKLPHIFALVRESLVHNFSRRGVQHRQRLLASMQVTSYNPHLGLLRSEHCWGEHRTVYSDRREADVVMTSIRTSLLGLNTFGALRDCGQHPGRKRGVELWHSSPK